MADCLLLLSVFSIIYDSPGQKVRPARGGSAGDPALPESLVDNDIRPEIYWDDPRQKRP